MPIPAATAVLTASPGGKPVVLPVVLSGAGLSADAPSNAPLGNELRNGYLNALLLASATHQSKAAIETDDLWTGGLDTWRLEVLLRILQRVMGESALAPLSVVVAGRPNDAHTLAAQLLSMPSAPRVHLTLNFDDYVERAIESGTGTTPESVTLQDCERLEALVCEDWQALRVPVVVHLHGRVVRDGAVRFPGLVATLDQIAAKPSPLLIGLMRRAVEASLLVVGYSGLDTDVWPTLLNAGREIDGGTRIWNWKDPHSVRAADQPLIEAGFAMSYGSAIEVLARTIGVPRPAPSRHAPLVHLESFQPTEEEARLSLAWIFQDIGGAGRQRALELLGHGPPATTSQLAWLWWYRLGTTEHELGRMDIAAEYLRKSRAVAGDDRTKAESELALADIDRKTLTTSRKASRVFALAPLALHLSRAWLSARGQPDGPIARQRSLRIAGHVILGLVEAKGDRPSWTAPTRLLSLVAQRLFGAATVGPEAHTSMFAHLQLAEAIAYGVLAGADRASIVAAHEALKEADDLSQFIGHGLARANLTCAKALVAIAEGNRLAALTLLDDADRAYTDQGHEAGRRLVERRRKLARGLR